MVTCSSGGKTYNRYVYVSIVPPSVPLSIASEKEIPIFSASSMLMLGGDGGKVAGRDGAGGNFSPITSLL